MRTVDRQLYRNDVDCVESLTAVVEHNDGRLEIVEWSRRHSAWTLGIRGEVSLVTH